MNEFERKWKECAARARNAPGREETAPFGFATRVWQTAASRRAEPVTTEMVLQRLVIRSLGLAGVLLVICLILELPHLRVSDPLNPRIEDTVALLVWNL